MRIFRIIVVVGLILYGIGGCVMCSPAFIPLDSVTLEYRGLVQLMSTIVTMTGFLLWGIATVIDSLNALRKAQEDTTKQLERITGG